MRVLVVDDHALFRRCLVDFLSCQEVVADVWDTAQPRTALSLIKDHSPDVVLVDLDLGAHQGILLAEEIINSFPGTAVVVLTACTSEEAMLKALELGADGYLVKDINPESLLTALRQVVDGEVVFSRSFLIKQVRSSIKQTRSEPNDVSQVQLTTREVQVLQLVTNGLMDKQVAAELTVSESTVKNHMKNIRKKLGASNRVQASLIGVGLGFIKMSRASLPR